MSGREMVAGPLGTVALVVANAGAWWESLSLGGMISGITLAAGAFVLAMGKVTEARNKAYIESENAKMQAYEDSEMVKMRVQQEWEKVNAGSLSRQIEEFRKQAARDAAESARKVEEASEDNKRIRASLHELRDQAHVVALQHTEETQALKASHAEELARLKRELEATNGELHRMTELHTRLLMSINAVGRKVDAASDNVQVLADQVRSSDAIPTIKKPGDATP